MPLPVGRPLPVAASCAAPGLQLPPGVAPSLLLNPVDVCVFFSFLIQYPFQKYCTLVFILLCKFNLAAHLYLKSHVYLFHDIGLFLFSPFTKQYYRAFSRISGTRVIALPRATLSHLIEFSRACQLHFHVSRFRSCTY